MSKVVAHVINLFMIRNEVSTESLDSLKTPDTAFAKLRA